LWFRNFKCFNFSRSIEQKFIAANFGMKTFTKIPVCKLCQTSFFANDLHTETLIKLITVLRTSLIFHNVPPNDGTCFNNLEMKNKISNDFHLQCQYSNDVWFCCCCAIVLATKETLDAMNGVIFLRTRCRYFFPDMKFYIAVLTKPIKHVCVCTPWCPYRWFCNVWNRDM
jgi:hypothetical protein